MSRASAELSATIRISVAPASESVPTTHGYVTAGRRVKTLLIAALVPEVGPSPIQQAKLQGRQRKRASGTAAKAVAKGASAAVGAGKPRVASRAKTAAKGSGKAWSWGDAR